MRCKFFLVFGIFLLALASCRKEVLVNTEPFKPPYRISGLANLKYELSPFVPRPFDFHEKILNVAYEHGAQKLVSIEITGAPAGMVVDLSSVSGYPGYDTKLLLRDTGMVAGTYNLKAVLKAVEETNLEFPFTVTVTGDASCLNYFSGTYSANRLCDSANRYPTRIVRAGSAEDTVLITNFQNTGTDLKAAVSCFQARLQIPRQVINSIVYSGYGEVRLDPQYYPGAPYIYLELQEENSPGSYKSCTYNLFFQK